MPWAGIQSARSTVGRGGAQARAGLGSKTRQPPSPDREWELELDGRAIPTTTTVGLGE